VREKRHHKGGEGESDCQREGETAATHRPNERRGKAGKKKRTSTRTKTANEKNSTGNKEKTVSPQRYD